MENPASQRATATLPWSPARFLLPQACKARGRRVAIASRGRITTTRSCGTAASDGVARIRRNARNGPFARTRARVSAARIQLTHSRGWTS